MRIKKYLNTKTFSKMLALGILINGVSINSFAGTLSGNGRYETFEDSDIAINDILEEDKVDVEIEGNTLINLIKTSDFYNYSKTSNSVILSGNSSVNNGLCDIKIDKIPLIKPNSKYTFIYNVLESTTPNTAQIYNSTSTILKNTVNLPKTIGINKVVFETKENINSDSQVHGFYIHLVGTNTAIDDNNKFIFTNAMILEGDWTNRDIPDYFEGMKSVGELENNNLEIKSQTKNLLDLSTLKQGGINPENGEDYDINFNDRVRSEFIKVKPNTKYSINSYNRTFEYDENKKFIKSFSNTKKFTTTSKTHYLRFHATPSIGEFQPNTQLEEGDSFTTPTKYANKVLTMNLSQPLRSLPNGVKDKIIKRNGQWAIERNIGKTILNGNEDWIGLNTTYYDNKNIAYSYFDKGDIDVSKPEEITTQSNIFNGLKYNDTYSSRTKGVEGISAGNANKLYIFIDTTKLETKDVPGLKKWLSNNNVEVIYKLETPIYEPLNIPLILDLYEGITYISTNSTIPANLKVTVDRVANRAKEYSELAKENPTIENISLARMWTNLMRESILKDEFQDNIDTITEITDMTLERKTASANLDVYIKSENMLSMNLSTNSITFEDFSGVEDMIKENAVNISINSSLPYNLNAYLATEIQNSDKSNTMNKDILSIKDNSELDYQTFTNTIDKVVLKSNCNSGNDKQHDINLKLNGGIAHEKDVYKTTIKFEAEQQ